MHKSPQNGPGCPSWLSSHEQHKLTPTKFTAVGFFDGGFVVVVVAAAVGLPDLLPCGRTGIDVVVLDGDGGSFITLAKVLADLLDDTPTELYAVSVVVSDNVSGGEEGGNGSFSALVSFPILADLECALLLFADLDDLSLFAL